MKIKLGLALLSAAFMGVSCNDSAVLHSGIILKNMDTTVSPGNNFYQYVNGNWIKDTPIPSDKSYYGALVILEEQAQENVKTIIEAAVKGKPAADSEEQKIGDLYESFMNMKVRDSIALAPLKNEFARVDRIATPGDLAAYFAYANRLGNLVPMTMGVNEDFKDPKKYMLYTWQGGLGLPDREYYLLTDSKSADLRTKYVRHIESMLRIAGLEHAGRKAADILALETRIASVHMKKENTRNLVALYNKYPVSKLNTLMADFDWKAFLTEAGVKDQDSLVVTQLAYTRNLNAIVKNTPMDTWKAYLKWGLVHGSATSLNTALDREDFDFYNKTMHGVKEQRPQWRRAVSLVNGSMGEMMGKLYVEKHFPRAAKERMLILVNNLQKAYESSIKDLDWMTPETKKQALDKLGKFKSKIGYPDKWRDYSALKIVRNDLFGNKKRVTEFDYQRNMKKIGKPVDRSEWNMPPQTVNAYYTPFLNEIVFPAAILQPPFFNLKAEDAVNYGGIGAIIGHEIGHGFDDMGSTFDGDGVMRDWWTARDQREFKKRTGALVSQYNAFKVFPDLQVNGQFTLGENIGDLGGISIALKAYKASLGGKQAPHMDGFTGEQRVLIGYAQLWMSNETEESLRNLVATNPHSPDKFRVNGPIRNIPEFYSAFNVKQTDSLYLAPQKRVKIW